MCEERPRGASPLRVNDEFGVSFGAAIETFAAPLGRLSPVTKRRKMTPETLRQRRVAFYHGIPRDTLRNAVQRANAAQEATEAGTTARDPPWVEVSDAEEAAFANATASPVRRS